MGDDIVILCEGVHVVLGRQEILRGLSLAIPRGGLVPIVGPNGAGKTTLLRAMLGLVPLRRGRIFTPFARRPPGYVPQLKSVDPLYPVPVRRIVEMGLYPRLGWWRRPGREERRMVDEALERLGLLAHQRKVFAELSGGMKQKALLARAFVTAAEVLLLDEPTSELDGEGEREVLRHLRALSVEGGRTIVFVHHGLHQAARLAQSLCWVEHGRARMIAAGAEREPAVQRGGGR